MDTKHLTIALAGNPNSGKTTIFNHITGTRQKVGNWPGVTVEKKEGRISKYGYQLKIVDLPGTYSLTPFSIEEIIARDYILDEAPDVVIDIIDASNLERNLYLATQLRELDCKVLFALNMTDLATTRGVKIDTDKLSKLLDIPVVTTVGNKNEGIDALIRAAIQHAETGAPSSQKRRVKYSKDVEHAIAKLQGLLEDRTEGMIRYNPRWMAIKLLENDKIVMQKLIEKTGAHGPVLLQETQVLRDYLADRFDDDPEIIMTEERYGFITGIVREILTTPTHQRVDISRNIDLVLTNRFMGFPIFLLFIWAMFQLTFSLGAYPMEWIGAAINGISSVVQHLLPDSLFKSLLVDGIIAGVGSVVVFLPNILILFFCIAIFEDTGYMARAAFLMDKIMHLIGLHGKSFIPMLMGFGCNVPAIMAARTLESEKDRILTILITPFMSCSARLPIYIVLAGTFFGPRAGSVIFSVYLFGIVAAIVSGRLLRSTILRGADAPFVMELPPYRVPMMKSLLIHMWDRSKLFLKKMGGIILVGSIVVWCLSAFPVARDTSIDPSERMPSPFDTPIAPAAPDNTVMEDKSNAAEGLRQSTERLQVERSYMGSIGKWLAPLFAPIGVDWRGSVAILTGFVAKEIVVSALAVIYGADHEEEDALRGALLSSGMTSLSALSMMVFVLLYIPCLATVTTILRETASIKWMMFSIVYSTAVAWASAFTIYQGGRLLGFG